MSSSTFYYKYGKEKPGAENPAPTPIQTLMLEGGGHLNGSLLNEGLIDELSLLILPIADGTPGTTTTFEVSDNLTKKPAALMELLTMERLKHDVIWLRYSLNKK